jgi:hypothetical protein
MNISNYRTQLYEDLHMLSTAVSEYRHPSSFRHIRQMARNLLNLANQTNAHLQPISQGQYFTATLPISLSSACTGQHLILRLIRAGTRLGSHPMVSLGPIAVRAWPDRGPAPVAARVSATRLSFIYNPTP